MIDAIFWDGRSTGEWTRVLRQTDAVVNACGLGLEHWPWTSSRERRQFQDSRVLPGMALASAIAEADTETQDVHPVFGHQPIRLDRGYDQRMKRLRPAMTFSPS